MITASIPHKTFKFPVGEMQVNLDLSQLPDMPQRHVEVEFTFEKNEDIIELLLFADAVKRADFVLGTLRMNYVPFSRQDRINSDGESFSLAVFANLINSLNFWSVVIHDPHSDVTPALFNNCVVVHQASLLMDLMARKMTEPYWLVSPDAGALKKTYHLAKLIRQLDNSSMLCRNLQGVIEASKIRDTKTGEITGTKVSDWGASLGECVDHTYCIIDDICDGGRTFIELAKVLRTKGAKTIHLYVTHGFFTKGLGVFDGLIDEVHAVHYRAGVR